MEFLNSGKHSQFIGVRAVFKSGKLKWKAFLDVENTDIRHIGLFTTEKIAACA